MMEDMKQKLLIILMVYALFQLKTSEGIEHRMVYVNGINMHVAEEGQGPVVLLIHGFPELWYTWRHQIVSLAAKGFRAVAPDLRGYGDTKPSTAVNNSTYFHIVGDLIALIDNLGVEKVFVVGHDWGAVIAWYLCLFRPDKVKALVNLSVVFQPRNPSRKPIETLRAIYGNDYYIIRFQEPGKMEAEFAQCSTANVLKKLLTYHNPGPFIIPRNTSFSSDGPYHLPSWLSEEDVNYYARKYNQTGFTGALNYYRALDLNWELTAAWTGKKVEIPVKFIVGDLDLTYNSPGTKEFIHGDGFKSYVPFLEEVVVMKGVGHFIHEERADETSAHIYNFIEKF
ncbi:hypothetical protein AQUCO_00300688v1 [Aquilegia coerulea]|uniref:soluble epoxide hydrolase n=1 Tax=Aquilegia coerulea TaxID=218851 RepID=A0A2G5EZZ2_AQUCA|nr:hypothetical protein AQUCO_00300688v1 [Aquilegia coerulea]